MIRRTWLALGVVVAGPACRSAAVVGQRAVPPPDPPSTSALLALCTAGGALVLTNVWLLLVVLSAIRRARAAPESRPRAARAESGSSGQI